MDVKELLIQYKNNPITEAIVLQGLEPLDSLVDVYTVAATLKHLNITDDFIIYTGYTKEEVNQDAIQAIADTVPGCFIIKWGRFKPNQNPHYDPVLGIQLVSENQYGEYIKK